MMPRLADLIADRMAAGGFSDREAMMRELDAWRRRAQELDVQLQLCHECSAHWRERYAETRLAFERLEALHEKAERDAVVARLQVLHAGLAGLKGEGE